MSDLIDRQTAIGIIQSMYPEMPRIPWMRKDWQERYEPYIRTENAIRELPSAQPEIIQCKDCKHYKSMFCALDTWTTEAILYKAQPNDFCSRGERRTDDKA